MKIVAWRVKKGVEASSAPDLTLERQFEISLTPGSPAILGTHHRAPSSP